MRKRQEALPKHARKDRSKDVDALWKVKQRQRTQQAQPAKEQKYEAIEMPKNSACGVVIAFFSVVTGFAMIWHIWWMAGAGAIGIFMTVLAFAFRNEEEIEIPAEQVARFERANGAEITI